jgi:hypothetical protein
LRAWIEQILERGDHVVVHDVKGDVTAGLPVNCQSASERDPGSACNKDPLGSHGMRRGVTARSRRRNVVTPRRSRPDQTRFLKRQLSLPVSMMSQ